MKYCNVTLDVGATINAFKTVWHYPEKFKNVVIHLGDFHFMKENFQVRILSLKLLYAIFTIHIAIYIHTSGLFRRDLDSMIINH